MMVSGQSTFNTPHIAPVTPDIANQLRAVEMPVSNYNGSTNFSVPLYEVSEGIASLPISLSYSSNGLKADEEASLVGLGWNLLAGGFIQFIPQYDAQSTNIAPYGIDLNPAYELDYQQNIIQNGCSYQTADGQPVSLSNPSDITYYGFEYPLYMYSFNGYSGKFFITPLPDNQIITVDRSNIVFEWLPSPSTGFKAITPDGMQYFFEDSGRGSSLKLNYHAPCSGITGLSSNTNSFTYNLTKIVSPNNDIITITYTSNVTYSLPALSQWYTRNQYSISQTLFTSTYNTNNNRIISEINSTNAKVKFTTVPRDDIYQGLRLSKIEIFRQGLTTPEKTINFNTDYFTGSLEYGDFTTSNNLGGCGIVQPQNFVTDNHKKKRLKLNSVNFNGITSYNFEYDNTLLPYKTSFSKDLWGYFNGAKNTTLLPDVTNLGYYDIEITNYFLENPFSGNRKSNEIYLKAGMLTKIIHPTKGSTEMVYESNSFSNPMGATQFIEVPVTVTDYGPSKETKEFYVPSTTANQTVWVNVQLSCVGPGIPCTGPNSGDCLGYSNVGGGLTPTQDNRLYILIEKKNTNGTWTDYKYFDRLSSEFESYCTFVGYIPLPSGTYRMTANFPDNKTNGSAYGGPWAQCTLRYKDFPQGTSADIPGGGLRIKSITEYHAPGKMATEKHYSYGSGKLITKPDYMYVYESNLSGATNTGTTNQCTTVLDPDIFSNCSVGAYNILRKETLYSDSILPYSCNAAGALVGYSEVTISYGNNGANGKEMYKYYNNYDNEFTYPGRLPGINGVRKLDNGLLREKFTYRNSSLLASAPSFDVVQYEQYSYTVMGYKKYWNFKSDYHPSTAVCLGEIITSGISDVSRAYLHFYPIVVGRPLVKQSVKMNYSTSDSGSPSTTVTEVYNNLYNNKYQLTSQKTINSFSENVETKTYYPHDILAIGQQLPQMQELINLNRINSPIRTEQFVNNEKISEMYTKYAKDALTGNLMLEKEIHAKKGAGNIDLGVTIDRKITFSRYDTKLLDGQTVGSGKLLQYIEEGGAPVSFIYGYNKTLPIAKIENIAYSAIPASVITSLQNSTNTGIDQDVVASLGSLSLNAALSQAMVTGYVYKPLVGVSYTIAPNRLKTCYQYDSLGRLVIVKDHWEHLLKEIQYFNRAN